MKRREILICRSCQLSISAFLAKPLSVTCIHFKTSIDLLLSSEKQKKIVTLHTFYQHFTILCIIFSVRCSKFMHRYTTFSSLAFFVVLVLTPTLVFSPSEEEDCLVYFEGLSRQGSVRQGGGGGAVLPPGRAFSGSGWFCMYASAAPQNKSPF